MNDRQLNRLAGITATLMAGSLAVTFAWVSVPAAAAAEQTGPLAALEASVLPTTATTRLLLARAAPSPCEATTSRYRAAQAALTAGDIEAADDIAVIADVLIEQCGWSRIDAALGGPHG